MVEGSFAPFKCKMCGTCCKNLRGKMGKQGLSDYNEFRNKSNLYLLVEGKNVSINLFEWELPALRDKAKELNAKLDIIPFSVCLDKNNTPIVFSYMLDHDICPFLTNENKCSIYDNRPLICQTYPLLGSGFGKELDKRIFSPHFGECPNYDVPKLQGIIKPMEAFKLMTANLGDLFFSCLRAECAAEVVGTFGSSLIKNNLMKRERIPLEEISKTLDKQIGLIEYILKNNLIDKETVETTIESLKSNEHVKQFFNNEKL